MDKAQALASGLTVAIGRALGGMPPADVFCVSVRPCQYDPLRVALLPPFLRVGSVAFRDEMTAFAAVDGHAVARIHEGEPFGSVRRIDDLAAYCDADTLQLCDELSRLLQDKDTRAAQVLQVASRLLAQNLLDARWAELAEDFIPVVHPFLPHDDVRDLFGVTQQLLDPATSERLHASIRSRAPGRLADAMADMRALEDRDALAAHLSAFGIDDAGLAKDIAKPGLLLRLSRHDTSRFGGQGCLPAGEPWPMTGDGTPLTFLCLLDLTDVHALLPHWPATGWLMFFAALDLIEEPEVNTVGAPARVFFGEDHVPAQAPDGVELLPERMLRPQRLLTLPTRLERPPGPGPAQAYEEAVAALSARVASLGGPGHKVSGHVSDTHAEQSPADEEVLLHLETDYEIDFMYADGGALQFRLSNEQFRLRRWSATTIHPSSC